VVLKNFVDCEQQQCLTSSVGCDLIESPAGESSIGLDLHLPYHGGPISSPFILDIFKHAFVAASKEYEDTGDDDIAKQVLAPSYTDLTGIALVYGPHGKMIAHHDSPVVPGRKFEWLAMITVGEAVQFTVDDEHVVLFSGDAMVMDAQSVLHGVDKVIHDPTKETCVGLPIDSRLGVLVWTALEPRIVKVDYDDCLYMDGLFVTDEE